MAYNGNDWCVTLFNKLFERLHLCFQEFLYMCQNGNLIGDDSGSRAEISLRNQRLICIRNVSKYSKRLRSVKEESSRLIPLRAAS